MAFEHLSIDRVGGVWEQSLIPFLPSQTGAILSLYLSAHPLCSTPSVPLTPGRWSLHTSVAFAAQRITPLLKSLPWFPSALGVSPKSLTWPRAAMTWTLGMSSQCSPYKVGVKKEL